MHTDAFRTPVMRIVIWQDEKPEMADLRLPECVGNKKLMKTDED